MPTTGQPTKEKRVPAVELGTGHCSPYRGVFAHLVLRGHEIGEHALEDLQRREEAFGAAGRGAGSRRRQLTTTLDPAGEGALR